MSEKVNQCNRYFECEEYAKEGIEKCEKCEYSKPMKSLFKPKNKEK